MKISATTILEFHTKRTQCHVDSLNYFAGLLGYHFPEHDNDKNHDPIRIGYAYANYVAYHPHAVMSDVARDAMHAAHSEHHHTAPHHVEYYQSVADIPHIILIEMICDWHSANFEQKNILHRCSYDSVADFFQRAMAGRDWTEVQRAFILETIARLAEIADYDQVFEIWRPLLAQ